MAKQKPDSGRKKARPEKRGANGEAKKQRLAPPPLPAVSLKAPTSGSSKISKGPETQQPAPTPTDVARGIEPLPSTFVDRGLPVPEGYGMDRLVALVRDPVWIFCYWELQGQRLPQLRQQRGQPFIDSCAWVLRIYRINEGIAVDTEIEPSIGNWYVNVGVPGRYTFELGLLSPDGEFISLLVSEMVETPLQGPSDVIDEEWRMRPDDEEALLRPTRAMADAARRGVSGFLGASRVRSSFAAASSGMLGSSASGRPVAGSWSWSFVGASGRVSGSGSGSGGFGWIRTPAGAQEPVLERPAHNGGPNWNAQNNLPGGKLGKTHQPEFKVKLPRTIENATPPAATWPPPESKRRSGMRRRKRRSASHS